MIRLGLCCIFRKQPIRFRTTAAAAVARLPRSEATARLAALCLANAESLMQAFRFCVEKGIGCFRILSQILPLKTHPDLGYAVEDLPDGEEIVRRLRDCGRFAREHDLRTTFHPDQFVVLNSPRPEVVRKSLEEIEYQAEVAEWVNADVINIHAGGAFADKAESLRRLADNLKHLSLRARSRLTLENDDRTYTPTDLLTLCRAEGIPLVYDVHHHRCNPDGISVEETTDRAASTWDREPLFHISSPLDGWKGTKPERHHDFIDVRDFPDCWRRRRITVEVEAKAKEAAVLQLRQDLTRRRVAIRNPG